MRTLIYVFVGTFIAITLLGLGILWLKAPQKIDSFVKDSFIEAGFQNATLPSPEYGFGRITYNQIALDPDNFSTLQTLDITYSPFEVLWSARLKTIKMTSLHLSGELDDNLKINIAGHNPAPGQNLGALLQLKAERIEFEDMRLALLSTTFGGLTLNGDWQIRPGRQGTAFQGRISAAQQQLSAQANIEGRILPSGFWDANIEIETAKCDFDALKITRIAGLAHLENTKNNETKINAELQAGALNILGLPWQNASITVGGSIKKPYAILAAKSGEDDGLELALNFPNIRNTAVFSGHIYTPVLSTLVEWAKTHNALPIRENSLKPYADKQAVRFEFLYNQKLRVQMKDLGNTLHLLGDITSEGTSNNALDLSDLKTALENAQIQIPPPAKNAKRLQKKFICTAQKSAPFAQCSAFKP